MSVPAPSLPPPPELRKAIESCQDPLARHIAAALDRAFARIDDWLFDQANRPEVKDGDRYLKAMRDLRPARAAAERVAQRHVADAGEKLLVRLGGLRAVSAKLELSLVGEEELEQNLAVELISDAVVRGHAAQFDEIASRLEPVLTAQSVGAEFNPFAPRVLAGAIEAAMAGTECPGNARLFLFKHYEREIPVGLEPVLAGINSTLERVGLRASRPAPAVAAPPPKPAPAASVPEAGGPEAPAANPDQPVEDAAVFNALSRLLRAWRPIHQGGAGGLGGGDGGDGGDGGMPRRPMASSEIMSVLSLMQNERSEAIADALLRPEVPLAERLKSELLQSSRRIGLKPDQVRMDANDEDAVDLVGMLFDVMFDERDFKESARSMISKLVVPFIKAAVLDRRMFLQRQHPARKYLNSLAEACEGNSGEATHEKDLLTKAQGTVDKLVSEFNEDMAIFETLDQELRGYLDQYKHRVELSERRAAESQKGQERLEQARRLAGRELDDRVANLALPQSLQEFLAKHWTHHLSILTLREGAESPARQAALSVADGLLALLPGASARSEPVAKALERLRPGIESITVSSGVDGNAVDDLMRRLGSELESFSEQVAAVAPMPAAANASATASAEKGAAPAGRISPAPLFDVGDGGKGLDFSPEDAEEFKRMPVGTWVQLAGDDGRFSPVKLSWVSPISNRLMFVNRRGVRMLVSSAEELAALKRKGTLLVRNESNLFEQAMLSVMDRLRKDVPDA